MTEVPASSAGSDPWSPPYVPGDVIADKYRIERLLGSGGMAWVFEATHLLLQKSVAIKFLRTDRTLDNTEALARFRREGRMAASISGEAIARVLDVGTLDDGAPFLVMECLEGCDLDRVIGEKRRLSIETAVHFAVQACEGLAETHAAGIIHRDLKPSNLFLTRASDGALRVKLLDFGVSKLEVPSSENGMTSTGALIGSPVYMSPEQMRSSRRVDHRCDIWSMGVILYELLADGRSPFLAATLPEICARILDEKPEPLASFRPDVPRALDAVVLRCLEKAPARRFQTVADLAQALVPFGPPETRALALRIHGILGKGVPVPRSPVRVPRALRVAVVVLVLAVPATHALRAAEGSENRAAIGSAPTPVPHGMSDLHFARHIQARQAPETTVLPSMRLTSAQASAPAAAHVPTRSGFGIAEFGGRE
jgi:serine/threonine protein kinase